MSLENETKPVEEEEKDDLEDFFSKKEKKGKKKKKKKNVELDASSDVKSKKEETQTATDVNINDANKAADDEEWNDFEEETKDYSDLKVQNFQISEEPVATEEVVKEYNEAGELMENKTNEVAGPWNKTLSSSSCHQESESTPTPPPPPEPVKPTGAYRPPAYRPPGMRSGDGVRSRQRSKQQAAPEINSVMDFPTLSAAAQDKEEKGFEVVKSGAKSCNVVTSSSSSSTSSASQPWRSRRQQQAAASNTLTTSNQFSALNRSRY